MRRQRALLAGQAVAEALVAVPHRVREVVAKQSRDQMEAQGRRTLAHIRAVAVEAEPMLTARHRLVALQRLQEPAVLANPHRSRVLRRHAQVEVAVVLV